MEAILGGVAFVGLFPALLVILALLTRDLGAFDSCAPRGQQRAAPRPTTKTPSLSPFVLSVLA
jgi:hypothetical protein